MNYKENLLRSSEVKCVNNGIVAIYKGKEYPSGKNKDGKYILRSSNIQDVDLGFQKCEPFMYKNQKELIVCYKIVERSELESLYRARIRAEYKGYLFEVVDKQNGKLSIVTMVGDYHIWEQFGMNCIDKGVYQKWIDESEAVVVEEKEQL